MAACEFLRVSQFWKCNCEENLERNAGIRHFAHLTMLNILSHGSGILALCGSLNYSQKKNTCQKKLRLVLPLAAFKITYL